MNTLWLVLTRKCNFDCGYCYQGSHAKLGAGLTPFFTPEVEEAGLAFALKWAESDGLRINLYGGEPLLYSRRLFGGSGDDGDGLVRQWARAFAAVGKRLQFGITTNGSLLDAAARAQLDALDISVLFSLDGPKKLHDQSRVYFDSTPDGKRRGTWDSIPVEEIAAWSKARAKPIELAWQLSPQIKATPEDLDEVLALGFRVVNFNIQWLEEWPPESRIWLEEFMRGVYRRFAQGKMVSNWTEKVQRVLTSKKMEVPCGTGLRMLALTPEGWLYPSQEMAFTAVEPGRAPGTAEHYRVGNVFKDPVIDEARLAEVSKIRTEQMRPPAPYSCDNCVAAPISIGGCHCRYIGQNTSDVRDRFGVAPGYCPSMISAVTGLLQGAAIEGRLLPVGPDGVSAPSGGLIRAESLLRRPAKPGEQPKAPPDRVTVPAQSPEMAALARIEARQIAVLTRLDKIENPG